MMIQNEPVIDMHDTWLVINSIQGCTNGCVYCFLQANNKNCEVPEILVSEEEIINQLLSCKYYEEHIPLCLLPGTDPFLNVINSNYVLNLLDVICEKNLRNPLVLITKCLIPNEVIEKVKSMQDIGYKIVFYLSYSGLPQEYEPNRIEENIKKNFKNLYEARIPIIHYYRPFMRANSKPEQIREVLDFVHQYTDVSVVAGLKVRENFIDKMDLEDVSLSREDCLKASCVWPREAYEYFFKDYKHPHFVFQTNYCALATVLKEACPSYYQTMECENYNHCGEEQRKRCAASGGCLEIISEVKKELNKLGYSDDMYELKEEVNNIVVISDCVSISDVAYLTRILKRKVSLFKKTDDDIHFNSSLTNTKPILY